ncbi:hypothetical protein BEQ56_05165 [Anaerolineaceae bacterium oral taxon 439]|nr:hypothetical protein BEQ56_05165 [Anaerolineaceae bacterium oral taxon 439]
MRFLLKIGLDVGSTTLKSVVLNHQGQIVYKKYERHFSQIAEKVIFMLKDIAHAFPKESFAQLSVSGSAGMGFAEQVRIPFVQEVFATKAAVRAFNPEADIVIELGGEDAKILFLKGLMEVRMNGSCAGGTGAFIDQMGTLLAMTPGEMNEAARARQKTYAIASRCGVFAKSDIQPLLNQGASKEDICASIFSAVVNQTIAGLAQGREFEGNILYLGGPLTFLSELRSAFDDALKTEGTSPENSLYYVALGAALENGGDAVVLEDTIRKIEMSGKNRDYNSLPPLFENEEAYRDFYARHHSRSERTDCPLTGSRRAYIGIDAGSTTLKAVVLNEDEEIAFAKYLSNSGNPVPLVKAFLEEVYEKFPEIHLVSSATTGYGEEIIKNAFHADHGVVETVAHFNAAKKFDPDVDFIIDIGGQDIKCFKIRGGAIDNIFLNEACSSGCGSFLQTFAGALGKSIDEFARLGLTADQPVDLGSRCTVFMNSSVKQAQKDGATIENISAGLSISVVKNALYKVIRVRDTESLGDHIVVQGGTFLNDAVLRAFEQEIGREVIRPGISGLMGAFGAALYAKRLAEDEGQTRSRLIDRDGLANFTHTVRTSVCNKCTNHCRLTINTFDGNRRFIGGNQCDRPITVASARPKYNLFEYKKTLLREYRDETGLRREMIGLPLVLNFYELLPFWHTFFTSLGFGVVVSPPSNRNIYLKGQHSIPSDTACYPAKIAHGHIEELLDRKVDAIFYPCMSYNFDEGISDNHYNCPVVAYYPEVVNSNMKRLRETRFIKDYVGIHRPKDFPKKIRAILEREFGPVPLRDVERAAKEAYAEERRYLTAIMDKGDEFLALAREKNLQAIVLSGRPYHLDNEINHGIDRFIADTGAVVLSDDSLLRHYEKFPTRVLNQWTYHARIYGAAKFVADADDPNLNLIQLVSFGCGVDAITTDETRSILEARDKIYTQIKIDEITNLGAVKIRIRSLFAAARQKTGVLHG